MSLPKATLFRYAIQTCRSLENEAVYNCLVSSLGKSSGRTLKEVLIRSVGIQVISLALYGHLMSMQGITSAPWRTFTMLLVFIFIPELSVAQFFSRVFKSSIQWLRSRSPSPEPSRPSSLWRWGGACLGSHISIRSGTPVPLYEADPNQVHYKRSAYGVTWFGRFVLLVVLLIQYSSSLGIRYRALTAFSDRWNSYTLFDLRNFNLVIGGTAAVLNSMLLAMLNVTWDRTPAPSDVESLQPSSTVELRTHEMQQNLESEATLQSSASIWRKIQAYNNIFMIRVNSLFPAALQHNIEGGIILHTITRSMSLFFFSPDFLDLSVLIMEKNPRALGLVSLRKPGKSGLSWLFDPIMGPFLRWGFLDIYLLPYISTTLVLIACGFRFMAHNTFVGEHMSRPAREFFKFCDKWITGGRSNVSFPFFFGFALCLTVWVDLAGLATNARWQVRWSSALEQGTHWDRLHAGAYMYKDPWYDSMYIL